MLKRQITIKTPGKLMVAGEFAILEPNNKLIVMAVDRFVSCTINDHESNEISLVDFGLHNIRWEYDGNEVNVDCTDPRFSFVKDAMTTTLAYLQEQSVLVTPFSLAVKSELDDKESGEKYGLGSSAAVVTSVITAILTKFIGDHPSRKLIFKLAAISHIRTQGNGSGADIAASTYGGIILYSSFQADWLKEELKKDSSISSTIAKDWKYLSIKRLHFPTGIKTCIGWTGSPASTASLVNQISKLKKDNKEQYNAFLLHSQQAIQWILDGIDNNELSQFFKGITENRIALSTLGKRAHVEIETEKLYKLSMEAKRFGGAGKLSGAGGGDCGIAFLPMDASCEDLHNAWKEHGIHPLQINVHSSGARQER